MVLSMVCACSSDDDAAIEQAVAAALNADLITTDAIADSSTGFDFETAVDLQESFDQTFGRGVNPGVISTNSFRDCVYITVTGTRGQFPITYELDFGTGCTGPRGNTRAGILTFTFSDRLINQGAVLTIERSNYVLNGRALEGTITHTNNSNSNIPDWTRTVTSGSITRLNGAVFTFNSTRSIRMDAGGDTTRLRDNILDIYDGRRTVTGPNGNTMTTTVITTLTKPYRCNYIVSGMVEINRPNRNGTIDYGDGSCDNQATYTNPSGLSVDFMLR